MQVESLWWPRLRWRMRGAWQWPAFFGLTAADAVVISVLPLYGGRGPDALGAVLLAGFLNLGVVAVLAPLAGWRLRRRRPDLPRMVANDYAGTALLALVTALLLLGGLLHRPTVAGQRADERSVSAGVRAYVVSQAPAWRAGLRSMDALQVEAGLWRACVPGHDPRRWLCLFVRTSQHPAGVTRDPDEAPNSAYRMWR